MRTPSYKGSDEDLQKLLSYDPLAEAEKVTGVSYKDDEGTMGLGFTLLQLRGKAAEQALRARGDTVFHNELGRYQGIVTDNGFELVYVESFKGRRDPLPEQFFIYWNPEGILLAFDTYRTTHVNGASIHYNWRPEPYNDYWPSASSSPHCEDWEDPESPRTYAQSMDAREGLIFNLEQLRKHGKFLVPWLYEPMLWNLSHHGDKEETGSYNIPGWAEARKALRQKRIEALPKHVRKAIEVVNGS